MQIKGWGKRRMERRLWNRRQVIKGCVPLAAGAALSDIELQWFSTTEHLYQLDL